MRLVLVCVFRSQGVRWPLRPGDTVEVWNDKHEHLGELAADLVLDLIAHHFHGLSLTELMRRATKQEPLPPPREMPKRAIPIKVQEQRRLKRRYPKRPPRAR